MDRASVEFPRSWEEVCNNPLFAEMPYRFEINRRGNIELGPHSLSHSRYQTAIQQLLSRLLPTGITLQECPIRTKVSNPVADVVWVSRARDKKIRSHFAYKAAPEICVEVRSPSNSQREMNSKRSDYFGAGALECWFCNLTGGMTFFSPEGELKTSTLCPDFPKKIKI